jgi:hypothetical protein
MMLMAVLSLPCIAQKAGSATGNVDLQYQNRGNRFEGVKPKPVSGYNVELVSVLADFSERSDATPQQFRLKFFLGAPHEVHLTVRELDYKEYYWLDKVRPRVPWRPGFGNTFAWPTADVIRQLNGVHINDLGVVARLDNPLPGMIESVAPVILYHSTPPGTVDAYLFTFKVAADARVTASVYRETKAEPLSTEVFRRQRAGRPFTVRWDCSSAEPGRYRLVLKGFFLENNAPVSQMVLFFHQPRVKP